MAIGDRYANVPFGEAIDYLRQKISLPTERWDDVLDAEHDAAFVVAGAKGSMLADIRTAVERAITEGRRPEEFRADFERITEGWAHKGDKAWRADIILGTNLRQAYAAGRYQRQLDPDVLRLQPYLRYIHGDSRNPRPNHLALDGQVFPATEMPFYPPSGFRCSCRAISLTVKQVADRGLEISNIRRGDEIPYTDENGIERTTIAQPDKGFDYIPAQSNAKHRQQAISNIVRRMPPDLRVQVSGEASQIDRRYERARQLAATFEFLSPDEIQAQIDTLEALDTLSDEQRTQLIALRSLQSTKRRS